MQGFVCCMKWGHDKVLLFSHFNLDNICHTGKLRGVVDATDNKSCQNVLYCVKFTFRLSKGEIRISIQETLKGSQCK